MGCARRGPSHLGLMTACGGRPEAPALQAAEGAGAVAGEASAGGWTGIATPALAPAGTAWTAQRCLRPAAGDRYRLRTTLG